MIKFVIFLSLYSASFEVSPPSSPQVPGPRLQTVVDKVGPSLGMSSNQDLPPEEMCVWAETET